MADNLVPAHTKLAAKRGFIRTTAQGYAATLSVGVSASVVLAVINGEVDLATTVVSLVVALVSPPVAGLVSYLQITANGIPEDYAPEIPPRDAETGALEVLPGAHRDDDGDGIADGAGG